MKTLLQISSLVATGLSLGAVWTGETDTATLYLVWAFYLKYLSDKRE